MNYEEMTSRQITAEAKKRDIVVNYAHSNGGGWEDRNRDHRSWFIEIWTGWQTSEQEFHNHCAEIFNHTGRIDGKQACEREAKTIALTHFLVLDDENKRRAVEERRRESKADRFPQ